MTPKTKLASIFRSQLTDIKDDWETRKSQGKAIFSTEINHYNSLIRKKSKDLSDNEISHYVISDECFKTSSTTGVDKYTFPDTALIQIRSLLKHIEGHYNIMYPEAAFIEEKIIREKYQLFLLDKNRVTSGDVLRAATVEFEHRLRELADLPDSCVGIDLANKALNPKDGKLKFKHSSIKQQEGYYNLVKGFFDFIRGKHHHVKIEMGRKSLYQELIIISKLLKELNNLIIKENEPTTTNPNQGE